MNFILENLLKIRFLDSVGMSLISSIILFTILVIYFLDDYLRDSPRKKNNKKKRKYFEELKRRYNLEPIKLLNEEIAYSNLFMIVVSLCVTISIMFSLIFIQTGYILILILLISICSIFIGIQLTILTINLRYETRKQEFENAFPEIGLVIKQYIKKGEGKQTEFLTLIDKISAINKYPVNEEFEKIKEKINATNDIDSVKIIKERYPESIYLPQLVEFLLLYYKTKANISKSFNLIVKEVRDSLEIKKRAEIEINPYVTTVTILLFLAGIFGVIYCIFNETARNIYLTSRGIPILTALLLWMGIGAYIVTLIKKGVTKDDAIKKKW